MKVAIAVASRADCTRRRIGAVILNQDHRIVSTGYNGAATGQAGCLTDNACPRGRASTEEVPPGSSYDTGPGKCISIHAEQNALMELPRIATMGCTMYVTDVPCGGCERMIKGSNLDRVVWPGGEWKRGE